MEALRKAAIINGKEIALEERKRVSEDVGELRKRLNKSPGLAVILVGDNPASRLYVRNKERACGEAGIKSFEHVLPNDAMQEELAGLIRRLNGDE
ncbi:MAG: bifunctional methylenetetrahydrofolate dehydrogenase/methenyltetrahydrofolate cyclohydrolase, partial [Deltaproteobacteria bacterium]|nr:bifunctional methylenetetrahydrofolate dehydrogenase/methenyltetrahydrofolate cyclohydrolase [Deltaproteobacteria bacterium]